MARALTAMQTAFVSHYVETGNASEAARRAGYSAKSADKQGHQLLENDRVARAVERARARLAVKVDVTREWLVDQLVEIVKTGKDQDKIAAAKQVSKMLGFDAPTKTDVTHHGLTPEAADTIRRDILGLGTRDERPPDGQVH